MESPVERSCRESLHRESNIESQSYSEFYTASYIESLIYTVFLERSIKSLKIFQNFQIRRELFSWTDLQGQWKDSKGQYLAVLKYQVVVPS